MCAWVGGRVYVCVCECFFFISLYNTVQQKVNTEDNSFLALYKWNSEKKVRRLIQICIPLCTITCVYSNLRNRYVCLKAEVR